MNKASAPLILAGTMGRRSVIVTGSSAILPSKQVARTGEAKRERPKAKAAKTADRPIALIAPLLPSGDRRDAIANHLDLFQGDQADAAHALHFLEKSLNLFICIDNLDDQRQLAGKLQYLGGMNDTRLAVAHRAAQHRRPRQPELARLEHDFLVERSMAALPALLG